MRNFFSVVWQGGKYIFSANTFAKEQSPLFFLTFASFVFCQYLRRPLDLGGIKSDLKSLGYHLSDGTKSKNGCLYDHSKVFLATKTAVLC